MTGLASSATILTVTSTGDLTTVFATGTATRLIQLNKQLAARKAAKREFSMSSTIEAHHQYGGLRLTCDEDTFARIIGLILADPSVAVSIPSSIEEHELQFVSVGMPLSKEPSRSFNVFGLITMIVAGGVSGVALLVGYFTVIQWLAGLVAQ